MCLLWGRGGVRGLRRRGGGIVRGGCRLARCRFGGVGGGGLRG